MKNRFRNRLNQATAKAEKEVLQAEHVKRSQKMDMIIRTFFPSNGYYKLPRNEYLDSLVYKYYQCFPYTSKEFHVPTIQILMMSSTLTELYKHLPRIVVNNFLTQRFCSKYYKMYYKDIV